MTHTHTKRKRKESARRSVAADRECERAAYFAANPDLTDRFERWARYEALILDKYGGESLDAAWEARNKAHRPKQRYSSDAAMNGPQLAFELIQ